MNLVERRQEALRRDRVVRRQHVQSQNGLWVCAGREGQDRIDCSVHAGRRDAEKRQNACGEERSCHGCGAEDRTGRGVVSRRNNSGNKCERQIRGPGNGKAREDSSKNYECSSENRKFRRVRRQMRWHRQSERPRQRRLRRWRRPQRSPRHQKNRNLRRFAKTFRAIFIRTTRTASKCIKRRAGR